MKAVLPCRFLCLVLLAPACGDKEEDTSTDSGHDHESDADTDTDTDADTDADTDVEESVVEGPDGEGLVWVKVNGTSAETWNYLDMEAPAFVDAGGSWSMAVRRYEVMVNGGTSGGGGVEVAWSDAAFSSVTSAPTSGWSTDTAEEMVMGSWYSYDKTTHVLTPAGGTYFIRSAGDKTYALEFLSYYSDDGDSGFLQLHYRPVADSREWSVVLDASDSSAPLYLSLDSGGKETVSGPAGLAWDLSVARTVLRTNGGVSGSGAGAAYTWPDGTTWEEVLTAPKTGWAEDVADQGYQSGAALSTWYLYNATTHAITPSGRVHAVRGADGGVWKLTVTSWEDGQLGLRVAPLGEAR